jgi:acetylcholinesterase/cholinesterase
MSSPPPVLVFIHGGNFKQGYSGGMLYDGKSFATRTGVILVTLNYRLGVLGQLYTGGTIKGSLGILDQRLALQWVRANIGAFGGDVSRITIFGQSAGAMSVATHMSSPGSAGLFTRAIMMSEPFSIPWRDVPTATKYSQAFAGKAGCPMDDVAKLESCIKGLSVPEIISAQMQVEHDIGADLSRLLEIFLPWTPTVGSEVLPMSPLQTFASGKAAPVDFMIGTVLNEGIEFVWGAFGKAMSEFEEGAILAVIFGLSHGIEVGKHYPVPASEKHDTRLTLSRVATEGLFVCPSRNATSSMVAAGQKAWVYHFDHPMSFGPVGWGPNYTECDNATCHGGELPFLFGDQNSTFGVDPTPAEVALSGEMEHYWANFAAGGDPGSGDPANPRTWPAWNATEQPSMWFETPATQVKYGDYAQRCDFWDSIGYNFY